MHMKIRLGRPSRTLLGKGRRRFAGLILFGVALAVTAAPAQASPPAEKGTKRTLTVAKAGDGTGSVSSSPAGIDCGATCAATFKRRAAVTLSASPDSGSTFDGWTGGGCSGTGQCAVTLADSTTVTATFSLKPSLVAQFEYQDHPYVEPGYWLTSHGFVQLYNSVRVRAVDASGDAVTSFAGTVALTSDCPLAVEGGATHAYGTTDGGTHSFSVGLGDHAGFGATPSPGVVWRADAGVVCTLTATDTSGAANPGSLEVNVAGDYCDNVDNNGNGLFDEAFPEKGTSVPGGGGIYVCDVYGTGLTPYEY